MRQSRDGEKSSHREHRINTVQKMLTTLDSPRHIDPSRQRATEESVDCHTGIRIGTVIARLWEVDKRIGKGGQGDVYHAVNIENGSEVAVKVEVSTARRKHLNREFQIYRHMLESGDVGSDIGISNVFFFGKADGSQVMVIDYFGPSLLQLFEYRNFAFSAHTTLTLFKHMLIAVRNLHANGIVHNDLKPDNICMGRGEYASTIRLIDFGAAEQYIDTSTTQHVQMENNGYFTGTVLFASLNAQRGFTCSRRDDLESVGYIMMYLYCKDILPQRNVGEVDDAYFGRVMKWKKQGLEAMCQRFPKMILDFFRYIKSLRFEEEPDYKYLLHMVQSEMEQHGFDDEGVFDWFYSEEGFHMATSTTNVDRIYDEILSIVKDPLFKEMQGSVKKVFDSERKRVLHTNTSTYDYLIERKQHGSIRAVTPASKIVMQSAKDTRRRRGTALRSRRWKITKSAQKIKRSASVMTWERKSESLPQQQYTNHENNHSQEHVLHNSEPGQFGEGQKDKRIQGQERPKKMRLGGILSRWLR